jgi:hypothetical protein
MAVKQSEKRWRSIAKGHNWFWHKYGDVRYCWKCNTVLPKTENVPDFAVAIVYTYVECKNSDKSGRWACKEISEEGARANQRAWLLERGGWLFIELGDKPAPKGKSAYLIPFIIWTRDVEPILREKKMASIRKETKGKRPGADELLANYRLEWIDGNWEIPPYHIWWEKLFNSLQSHLITVRNIMDGGKP